MADFVKFILAILTVYILSRITRIQANGCFKNFPKTKSRFLHFQGQSLDFTLQTSSRIRHQLTTEVLKIFLEDLLGYQNIKLVRNGGELSVPKMFNRLFETYERAQNIIPLSMVNVDVLVPPDVNLRSYLNIYPMSECGNIAPAGRFGWFIPEVLSKVAPNAEHWRFFRDPSNVHLFDISKDEDSRLLKRNSINIITNRYYCDENYCEDGMFIPEQCKSLKNQSCALMLSSFPETTNFIIEHIKELKLYMKVVWLGSNLKEVTDKLTNMYSTHGNKKSLIFLEWMPGYFTIGREKNFKLSSVSLPSCEQFKSSLTIGCKYDMTRNTKLVWTELQNIARPALEAIHKIQFNKNNYENLLRMYNSASEKNISAISCQWLQNNEQIWRTWLPTNTDKREIYIGGIFPISGSFYNAYGIVLAARMAQDAINNNSTILTNYNLKLLVNDGKCKTDMVMKAFIDYIFNNEYQNLIGVLGPACSETVEPLAGVSKHYSTIVMSYSAEGSSFSDRSKYPYFFRTIGENKQYQQVYLHLFKTLGWNRIAALTEDGQKYTEYISSMGDMFQANGISFIANMKFPREHDESLLSRYLQDLKEKRARIIIADIYDDVARMVMCEAYKQEMTSKEGYVWFLPPWLSAGWYNITHFNKYFNESTNCTMDIMLNAINGHFALKYAYFAPNDAIMEENITVGEWRNKYERRVGNWSETPTAKEFNPYTALNKNDYTSDYAGYVYDAVWTYALAADRLLKENPESFSDIHSQATTMKLVKMIGETDISGVSGNIKFYGGPSRFSVINIVQWHNNLSNLVGNFYPNISQIQPEVVGGRLELNISAITWLTTDGSKPEDGTTPPEECFFGPIATFLNISCSDTIILINVIGFSTLGIAVTIAVTTIKRRYERKIRLTEAYMKSMGIDKYSMVNMTNLDKWETSRECVVINRKIGEGAFGTVYGGEAQLGDEIGWVPVAVKTLKVGSTTEEKLDFLSEAESMKRFEHKNIVKLLGVCTKSEPVYTIMEFMLYGDLKTFLLARRHLVNGKYTEESEEISNKKLTSMALDIARALSYLAELKYVHRDVACRNCLVNSQRVVKLGDFGMTRLIFENDYYRFSRKGMLPVRWMAPESLGLGIFTPASDVWSYGVLLYEIITFGSFPFQGLSNNEVLECVKNGRTLTIPTGIKPQLEGLMKSCWNKDYKTRPHASEIAEFLANSPRLLAPCLDVPITSVQLDYPSQFDILPELISKHSIHVLPEDDKENDSSVVNSLRFDNPNYISGDINTTRSLNNNKKPKFKDEFTTESIMDDEVIPFV